MPDRPTEPPVGEMAPIPTGAPDAPPSSLPAIDPQLAAELGTGGAQVGLAVQPPLSHPDDPGFGVLHYQTDGENFTAQAAPLPGRSRPGSKRRASLFRRLGWAFWISVGWVVLVILLAVLAGVLPLPDPNKIPSPGCLQPPLFQPNALPSAGHWLGCDDLGRDVLSRVILGSRVSLIVGFASIALAMVVGGIAGMIAGYIRGAFDSISGIISNVLLAYPYLVLALAIVTFLGHSLFNVTVVIAIVAVAPLFRVVRANTIAFSERDYVLAARALGSNRMRVLKTLIIPDVIPAAITYGLVGVALAITGEGALSYLGLSVPATSTPTWGNMINEGGSQITSIGSPGVPVNILLMLGPAAAMFLFILAINIIGDRLRALLDVRTSVV